MQGLVVSPNLRLVSMLRESFSGAVRAGETMEVYEKLLANQQGAQHRNIFAHVYLTNESKTSGAHFQLYIYKPIAGLW